MDPAATSHPIPIKGAKPLPLGLLGLGVRELDKLLLPFVRWPPAVARETLSTKPCLQIS